MADEPSGGSPCAEQALGQPRHGSESAAHLIPSTLPYFSRQSRWQWEDKEAKQK